MKPSAEWSLRDKAPETSLVRVLQTRGGGGRRQPGALEEQGAELRGEVGRRQGAGSLITKALSPRRIRRRWSRSLRMRPGPPEALVLGLLKVP